MHRSAARTHGPLTVDPDRDATSQRPVGDTDHDDVGQADQQRAHARSIGFQAGAPRDRRLQTSLRIAESLCRARDPYPTITQPSDAERPSTSAALNREGQGNWRAGCVWDICLTSFPACSTVNYAAYTPRLFYLTGVATGAFMMFGGSADAHDPAGAGYDYTCSSGRGAESVPGVCYTHHSDATARFIYGDSVGSNGYVAALDAGYQAWDQTFNHVFNYTREGIDSANNANVTVTSVTICGSASAVGCTSTVVSSGHIQEGSSSIRFKSGLSTSTVTDAAAHEFGHYAGLGHSDVSTATMWATVHSGMDSLGTPDILGRCEIYGHSHAYWTSCTQT